MQALDLFYSAIIFEKLKINQNLVDITDKQFSWKLKKDISIV